VCVCKPSSGSALINLRNFHPSRLADDEQQKDYSMLQICVCLLAPFLLLFEINKQEFTRV
jgi:hypothetical protein